MAAPFRHAAKPNLAMLKILVFAHTPPPVHGQSMMVATLVEGLRSDSEIQILHVNCRLSRDAADIGSWRIGKLFALLGACCQAWKLRLRHGPAFFYYVPGPGKRGALYRDFAVMLLCRPFFSGIVFHWHAIGLARWLDTQALSIERWLARILLGRVQLSIALAPTLTVDATRLGARRVAIVPNCVPEPAISTEVKHSSLARPCEVLFLGLCSREKGLFVAIDAIELANRSAPGAFRLTVAGDFADPQAHRQFQDRIAGLPQESVRYVGFADERSKPALFRAADIFCFPTCYAHEGQPLVLAEALAYDLPIVTTRWRAIPDMLPAKFIWLVEPKSPAALAVALSEARASPRPNGMSRRHYLERFTPRSHLAGMKAALLALK